MWSKVKKYQFEVVDIEIVGEEEKGQHTNVIAKNGLTGR